MWGSGLSGGEQRGKIEEKLWSKEAAGSISILFMAFAVGFNIQISENNFEVFIFKLGNSDSETGIWQGYKNFFVDFNDPESG